MRASITPGKVWLDAQGNRIQAQGGSIIDDDGALAMGER